MANEASSLKKAAVLTGLTMVIGGAEISNADAAQMSQTDTFDFSNFGGPGPQHDLQFTGFNNALGQLTAVQLVLNSQVTLPHNTDASTSVVLFGQPFPSTPNPVSFHNPSNTNAMTVGNSFSLSGVSGTATLADYIGASFNAVLTLSGGSEINGAARWFGTNASHGEGLTVTYTYTPAVQAVPLPATLPLFAGGLAGLGFITWRSRRKQTAKE